MACEETVVDLGKLDIRNSCFCKDFLTVWRSGKMCCPACINSDSRKVDTFLQNGLSLHYRSSHRRSEFSENTVKRGREFGFRNWLLMKVLAISKSFHNLVPRLFSSLATPVVKRPWYRLVTCLLKIICIKGWWVVIFLSIGDRTYCMFLLCLDFAINKRFI